MVLFEGAEDVDKHFIVGLILIVGPLLDLLIKTLIIEDSGYFILFLHDSYVVPNDLFGEALIGRLRLYSFEQIVVLAHR